MDLSKHDIEFKRRVNHILEPYKVLLLLQVVLDAILLLLLFD